jgi:hypothetical protein
MMAPTAVVTAALSQILETMYFCVPDYYGAGRLVGPTIGASVAFSGTVRGEFSLVASRRLIGQFAADYMGLDSDGISEANLGATLRELANVVCCATIAAWMPGEDFHFAIPQQIGPNSQTEPFDNCFLINEGPEMALNFQLD